MDAEQGEVAEYVADLAIVDVAAQYLWERLTDVSGAVRSLKISIFHDSNRRVRRTQHVPIVWVDGQLRSEGRAEKYNRLLGVPEGRTCRVMMPIGVAAGDGPRKEKKTFAERASFNRHL